MKITDLPADHSARKSKTCRTCGEFKSPEEFQFWKQKNSYGGYQSSTACKIVKNLES